VRVEEVWLIVKLEQIGESEGYGTKT